MGDVVKLELHDRERELAARNDKTEAWRASRYNRDDSRWQAVEKKELDHQNHLDRLQDDPMIGRKNCGGQPYNIVNHRYDDNPITGEQTHELKAPKKPDPDPQLRGFF